MSKDTMSNKYVKIRQEQSNFIVPECLKNLAFKIDLDGWGVGTTKPLHHLISTA